MVFINPVAIESLASSKTQWQEKAGNSFCRLQAAKRSSSLLGSFWPLSRSKSAVVIGSSRKPIADFDVFSCLFLIQFRILFKCINSLEYVVAVDDEFSSIYNGLFFFNSLLDWNYIEENLVLRVAHLSL